MKRIYIFISMLAIASSHAQDEIDRKMSDTLDWSPSYNKDLLWITDEIRPIVVERLKEKGEKLKKESTNPFADYIAEGQLISMGHQETIEKYVKKMIDPTYPSPLEGSATELAIPYLMPVVYSGSLEKPVSNTDVSYPSTRDYAVHMVLGIISYRNVFSPEARKWADKMTQHLGQPLNEERIGLLKQWWEKNQAAILEKRYSDATWLPPLYKGEPSCLNYEETDERLARQEPKKVSDRESGQPTAVADGVAKNPHGRFFWITTFVALGVLLMAWVLRKLKRG